MIVDKVELMKNQISEQAGLIQMLRDGHDVMFAMLNATQARANANADLSSLLDAQNSTQISNNQGSSSNSTTDSTKLEKN